MTRFFTFTGHYIISALSFLGQLARLSGEVASAIIHGKPRYKLLFRQIVAIGFGSQTVVIVTGAFTGAVFAAQSYFKFNDFGVESSIGAVVSIAMCRELGPVLTGLMVSGRVGAAMAAEIGIMKVTEQIDALRVMAVHPIEYLVVPRTLGILISMPLLIAESIMFGILASHVVAVYGFNIPEAWYTFHLKQHTALEDIFIGMLKGLVFGYLIVIIACHQGLRASHGAVGVGKSTTSTVVIASLALLICNFFLTFLLNFFFPLGVS
jgi:phospholipid/cholesterol/gamma-HCH transport system permease protein